MNFTLRDPLLALGQLIQRLIQPVTGIFKQLFGIFEIVNPVALLHDSVVQFCIPVQLAINKRMSPSEFNPVNLRLDLLHLFSGLLEQLLGVRLPLGGGVSVILIVTFHAALLNGIKGILLFGRHTGMTVQTLNLVST